MRKDKNEKAEVDEIDEVPAAEDEARPGSGWPPAPEKPAKAKAQPQTKEQQDANAHKKMMEYSVIKILGQGAYACVKLAMHK